MTTQHDTDLEVLRKLINKELGYYTIKTCDWDDGFVSGLECVIRMIDKLEEGGDDGDPGPE